MSKKHTLRSLIPIYALFVVSSINITYAEQNETYPVITPLTADFMVANRREERDQRDNYVRLPNEDVTLFTSTLSVLDENINELEKVIILTDEEIEDINSYYRNLSSKHKDFLPKGSLLYMELLVRETEKFFPEIPDLALMAGMVEKESCLSRTHSRCWNPRSELLSAREQGVGFGQLTRAFRVNSSGKRVRLRFDSLKGVRDRYRTHLSDLSWDNIKERPELQMRAMVLMMMENYNKFKDVEDPIQRWHFAATAYNGGMHGVRKERVKCKLLKGCDPQYWEGHVEHIKGIKSMRIIYGRSIWKINHTYSNSILKQRTPRYRKYYIKRKWILEIK